MINFFLPAVTTQKFVPAAAPDPKSTVSFNLLLNSTRCVKKYRKKCIGKKRRDRVNIESIIKKGIKFQVFFKNVL